MNLDTFADRFKVLADSFEAVCKNTIKSNADQFPDYVREQLLVGVDGNEKSLSPTYLNDPYFNEDGPWKGNAEGYKKWKQKITPPEFSDMLGISARDPNVPNLIITGTFHDSIKAVPIEEGVRIESQGCDMASDIIQKYGGQIFKIGEHAGEHFYTNYLRKRIRDLCNKAGLILTSDD